MFLKNNFIARKCNTDGQEVGPFYNRVQLELALPRAARRQRNASSKYLISAER
jgi:hypothetical protein